LLAGASENEMDISFSKRGDATKALSFIEMVDTLCNQLGGR